jgi:hypothetical protein
MHPHSDALLSFSLASSHERVVPDSAAFACTRRLQLVVRRCRNLSTIVLTIVVQAILVFSAIRTAKPT